MKAILLAAGYGKRLRPFTNDIPKCLIEINNRPIIDYWIEALNEIGIKELLINTHYKAQKVEEYLSKIKYEIKITLTYEKELLNTAGTIKENKLFVKNEEIMLIHADNFSLINFYKFIKTYKERNSNIDITMLTYITDQPELAGIVNLNDNGEVIKFTEKQKIDNGKIANGAVYIISKNVINEICKINKDIIDFSVEILPKYIGKINTYHNNDFHIDIGNIRNLRIARQFVKTRNITKFTL